MKEALELLKINDELIKEFIKELGYEKIAKLYDKAEDYFWYA